MHDRASTRVGAMRSRCQSAGSALSLMTAAVGAAAVVMLLAGCSGRGREKADTAGAPAAVDTARTPEATGGAVPAPSGSAAATSGNGKTVRIQMVGDAQGYRFEPASVTIRAGDTVEWVNVSGGPHDVAFWADSIPSGASQLLQARMQQTIAPLAGPLLATPNQTYDISFAGAQPGTYKYYCTPHLSLGMRAQITVQP